MGLDEETKLIWLLDCWTVHISKDFICWLKISHPHILLIFVPANSTSVFQPTDVILQRPFKHGFRQQFDTYTSKNIGKQIDEKELENVELNTKMSVLKPLLYSWLYQAWQHINKKTMIKRGWSMCGLDQAFESSFQTYAMEEHMKSSLFNEVQGAEEFCKENDDETDPDESIEAIMEKNLSFVAATRENKRFVVTTMKDRARKKYVHSKQVQRKS